ncbi:hypothetical protein C8F01DRAFT_162080 [Mycena amicta]|nr:hypothetical protein C8F01DRAFT_162080 [Mycena amicta]
MMSRFELATAALTPPLCPSPLFLLALMPAFRLDVARAYSCQDSACQPPSTLTSHQAPLEDSRVSLPQQNKLQQHTPPSPLPPLRLRCRFFSQPIFPQAFPRRSMHARTPKNHQRADCHTHNPTTGASDGGKPGLNGR